MNNQQKEIDPLPDEEFWVTHDTTDYPDSFETVPVKSELKRRQYEVEIDP